MDLNAITSLIGSLGFPTVCVIAMYYMLYKEQENHKVETEKWIEAINNNTKAIEQILSEFKKERE